MSINKCLIVPAIISIAFFVAGCGGGSSTSQSTVIPTVNVTKVVTENCITSSSGDTQGYSGTWSNFILPTSTDLAIFSKIGFTCARIPIGSGEPQNTLYVNEANAYHAAGIRVQGVVSNADINNLPVTKVIQASDEIEAGNELNINSNFNPTSVIAYTKTLSTLVKSINPNITVISNGVSSTAYLAQTIPSMIGYIDCIGFHPYGVNSANFGSLANQISSTYNLPVCYTEWGDTPGNRVTPSQINQAFTLSQGNAAEFNFFNLGQLETNSAELNAL